MEKDIKPYIDPKPDNNIILTATESLTMNRRPSNPKYARNKNQRNLLQEYTERNGLAPFIHVCDDGFSGTNWLRPGWQKVLSMVDAGEVACVCINLNSQNISIHIG